MSRMFYYSSILKHFFGERYEKYIALSSDLVGLLYDYSSDANIHILSFLWSVCELLETGSLNKAAMVKCARNSIENIQTSNVTEVWLVRSVDNQPSKETLQDRLHVLTQVCQTTLIPPLVQMVHSYCSGNVERFQVGMPVELLDTQIHNGPWRIAVLEKIECIRANGEVFFYISYVGWESYYNEWIPAQSYRIKLLYDRQGEIVRKCEFYSPINLVLGQQVDYYWEYNSNVNGRGCWKKGIVYRIDGVGECSNIALTNENQLVHWSRCTTKYNTFS